MTTPAKLVAPERKLWVVIGPDGQKHYVDTEPLEGMDNWARGQNVVIDEFVFRERIHPKVAPK
jgi:hypothetical protein